MDVYDSIPTMNDFAGYDVILLYEDGLLDNSNEVGDSLYYYVLPVETSLLALFTGRTGRLVGLTG